MKTKARIFSFFLSVCLIFSFCCTPAAAAKYESLTFTGKNGEQIVYLDHQYKDISELPIRSNIILTGMPDYNAAYNDGQFNYVGFNTDKGTWYICLGGYSVEALKQIVPDDGSITEFTACGTFNGFLEANGLPLVDLQIGQALVYDPQAGGDIVHSLANELPARQQEIDAAALKAAQEAAAAEAAAKAQQETKSDDGYTRTGQMVWIPVHGGTKYHRNPNCSNMKGPAKVDLGYAKALGYTACKRCY